MSKTPLQKHLEETPNEPIIGLKLKDLKVWLQHLPNDFLEYPLLVAQQGITLSDLIIYDKQYVIRGFDVDTVDKQILFLHAIDDHKKIITLDTTSPNE